MEYQADTGSLSLRELHFWDYSPDTGDELDLDFDLEFDTELNAEGEIVGLWELSLTLAPLFEIEADYAMYIQGDYGGKADLDTMVVQTSYPILADFAMLIAVLTKSFGAISLVIDPNELLERAGYEVEEDEE